MSVVMVETRMTVGMSSASARVTLRSSTASLTPRKTGIITAARPEVEGITNESGIRTAVISQKTPPTERARFTTRPVRRPARPVWRIAPPRTKAPIMSQITSDANAS
jgi:hypothetical protein